MSEANTHHAVLSGISAALDMVPLILDPKETPQNENLPAIVEEVELSKIDKEAEEDFELARANFKKILDKGDEALDGILRIASGSEHPRAYEVAANLIKTMTDANQNLLALHEKRRQLVPDPDPEPEKKEDGAKNITNNNVFIGSTNDLLDMIAEREAQREAERKNVIEHDS